jgi:hypothetical protein
MNKSSASVGKQIIILTLSLEPSGGRPLIPVASNQEGITMLSRKKYTQLAAVAALTMLFGANASLTSARAQAGAQPAQADQKQMQKSGKADVRSGSTTARAQAQTDQNTQNSRKGDAKRSSSRNVSSDRTRRTVSSDRTRHTVSSNRTGRTVSSRTTTRTVVRHRDGDRRRVVVRSRPSTSVAFVVLGPRVAYTAYGSGWCRGLHRGRHYDRRNGWHAGRHYGPFRC